jgi:hypothetical protein
LAEFGVERGTITDQSEEFLDQYQEYRRENGSRGDWSGFNPTSN